MSRWVRCSYGKRAGFVGAKIEIISESYKFLRYFCQFSPKKWFHKPCERLFYILFWYKAIFLIYIFQGLGKVMASSTQGVAIPK
jgi:hypothetical protein